MIDPSKLLHRKSGPKIKVPPKAHPLVRLIYEVCIANEYSFKQLARVAGVSSTVFAHWHRRTKTSKPSDPQLSSIEACLNALGYDLIAVKRNPNPPSQ